MVGGTAVPPQRDSPVRFPESWSSTSLAKAAVLNPPPGESLSLTTPSLLSRGTPVIVSDIFRAETGGPTATNSVGQADTAKQVLEARVGAEVVNPQISFDMPTDLQGSLLVSFF